MVKKPGQRTGRRLMSSESRTAHLCMIPAYVGLVVLTYVPLLAVFGLSLFKWEGVGTPTWVGAANYVRLFTRDPYFIDSVKATVLYALLSVFGSMIWSMVIALLLNRRIPARGFFRAIFYLPYVLPAMAVYLGWSWLYESNFGLFNYIRAIRHQEDHVPRLLLGGAALAGAHRRMALRKSDRDFSRGASERSPRLP